MVKSPAICAFVLYKKELVVGIENKVVDLLASVASRGGSGDIRQEFKSAEKGKGGLPSCRSSRLLTQPTAVEVQ
jgi:hypothetical protein